MLTCEDEDGRVRGSRNVVVDRGESVNVGRVCTRSGAYASKRG